MAEYIVPTMGYQTCRLVLEDTDAEMGGIYFCTTHGDTTIGTDVSCEHAGDPLPTDLQWWPHPGHHEGQDREHIFYAQSTYRGMTVELYEAGLVEPVSGYWPKWDWSFYDPRSEDPDVAVATGSNRARHPAIRELLDYIDGHVPND